MAETFSLVGGPFHRLVCRTGLVRGGTDSTAFGLVLGAMSWAGLLVLALAAGVGGELFTLSRVSGHARLLLVIPLLFFAESLMDPRVTSFVGMLVQSEIVPVSGRPLLESTLARLARLKDWWLPDALCLVLAVLVSLSARQLPLFGATAAPDRSQLAGAAMVSIWWYWIICLTIFRFLLLRWVWRLLLWAYTLWLISRLELHLVPTHPDGAAGLGGLDTVQIHFLPMVVAISVLQSASLAEEVSTGAMTLEGVVPAIAFVLIVDVILFIAPPFVFFPKLWACKVKGLRDYMEFASEYVTGFDRKWRGRRSTDIEELLGTPDLQSLADLNNSVNTIRNMRPTPVSQRLYVAVSVAAAVPMLPLLLFRYPLEELAARFVTRLTGF